MLLSFMLGRAKSRRNGYSNKGEFQIRICAKRGVPLKEKRQFSMNVQTPSRLAEKIWSAHQAQELGHFSLPENTLLLDVQRNGQGHYVDAFCLGTSMAPSRLSFGEAMDVITRAVQPKALFIIKASDLPRQLGQAIAGSSTDYLQIIPVSLLAEARGYLLLPSASSYDYDFGSYFPLLGEAIEECLFDALEARYSPAHLYALADNKALLEDYAQAISDWLCPYECFCNDRSLFQYHANSEAQETLALSLVGEGELQFRITAHGYPVANTPDYVHELSFIKLRKHKLRNRLTGFFNLLHQHWEYVRSERPLEAIIRRFERLHKDQSSLNESLDAAIAQLKDAGNEGAGTELAAQTKPFAFFRTPAMQWKVFFKSQECGMDFSYKQGMEMLQRLLSQPEEQIEPDDMYDMLKGDFTYNTNNADAAKDTEQDKTVYQMLKEDYALLIPIWEKARDKPIKKLSVDEADTLAMLQGIVDTMLKHRFQPQLVGLRTGIKRKLDEYVLHRGLDMEHSNRFKKALKESEPSGNSKNRLDSLSKGLKKAIDAFEPHYPDLYRYLNETIVRTKKDGRKTRHLPFTFVPSLAEEENLRDIYWETSDEG